MPTFMLHHDNLTKLHDSRDEDETPLEVSDQRDDHNTEDGDGVWIGAFLSFVEEVVRERSGNQDFCFSDYDQLDEDILTEIEDPYTRGLIIAFSNRAYDEYRDEDVEIPNYDDVRSDCRDFCDDCESGWTETNGEYDGPLAEDVDDDEVLNDPGITPEERRAREDRNRERARERRQREQAREDAESEVIDRDLTCDDDCDSFRDHVDECLRDRVDTAPQELKRRWKAFLDEIGETCMPELVLENHASVAL